MTSFCGAAQQGGGDDPAVPHGQKEYGGEGGGGMTRLYPTVKKSTGRVAGTKGVNGGLGRCGVRIVVVLLLGWSCLGWGVGECRRCCLLPGGASLIGWFSGSSCWLI